MLNYRCRRLKKLSLNLEVRYCLVSENLVKRTHVKIRVDLPGLKLENKPKKIQNGEDYEKPWVLQDPEADFEVPRSSRFGTTMQNLERRRPIVENFLDQVHGGIRRYKVACV